MAVIKKILVAVATIALLYFAPYLAPQIGAFLGAGTGFLAAVIGSVVIAAGLSILQMIGKTGSNTSMEAGKVNVRIPEPPRWIAAGRAKMGGGALFGEFDSGGNFWYLVVHGDSILTSVVNKQLDEITLTIDGNGYVLNSDFTPDVKNAAWLPGGIGKFIRIYTTTYTEANPTPPAIAAFKAACPQWTDDHKLVGTTYSVVVMKSVKLEDRYKLFKWRGPFGIGEPAVNIVGMWSNMYDPRDETQVLGDRSTYKPSRNPELIWAWFRTHRYGRNKSESSINWDRVAEQADICDQTVEGISGTHVRYQCDVSIPENKERIVAEQEIMLTCDGQLVFDDEGKAWVRVGHYETPTMHLSRNRDIVAMESVEARNGESETQGVIVRYIDPDANYTTQPSAPWYNPLYYVEGLSNQFMTVDIPGIQDHNQAMRIAKAIGERSQPAHKILPTTGLRGLVAMRERFCNLQYDNTFAGDYEIVTPVEVDEVGMFCGFGMVPLNSDRWTLLAGEEKNKGSSGSSYTPVALDDATGVVVVAIEGRIEATFDAPPRDDISYRFQYIKTADIGVTDVWYEMGIQMDDLLASSRAPLEPDVSYTVRYRTVSSGGLTTDWVEHGAVTTEPVIIDYDGGDATTEV